MGIYGDHVLPRMINTLCGMKSNEPLRERVCEGLTGDVVEIGFGSGLDIPFYPRTVSRVSAVEPADIGWKLAQKRLDAAQVPVERSGLDGQSLPFDDATFDSALTSWTLCTVPDPGLALAELRRVLSPAEPSISSSTASLPTKACSAGSTGSSRSRSASSVAAT